MSEPLSPEQSAGGPARRPPFLQSVAAAGMELCWLFAAVAFFFQINGLPSFPALGALALFLAATLPYAVARGRGWRIYQVGLLYLIALLLGLLVAVYTFGRWTAGLSVIDPRWILAVIEAAFAGDGLVVVLVVVVSLLFWWIGIAFARRAPTPDAISRRFDLGIGVLLAVALIGWAAGRVNPSLHLLIPSFFLFSILAIGMARTNGSGSRSFAAGFRGAGIAFSLGLALVVLGLALLLLLPLFQEAARHGYVVLRGAAATIGPLVVAVLRFLLGLFRPHAVAYSTATAHQAAIPALRHPSGRAAGPLEAIVMWTMIGTLAALVLAALTYLLRRFVRFLALRTPGGHRRRAGFGFRALLRLLLSRAAALARALRALLKRRAPRRGDASEAFACLSRWGARSGAARRRSETPLQYGVRLARRFPEVVAPIQTIVESFGELLYGDHQASPSQVTELERCCRALGTPRLWYRRTLRRLLPAWREPTAVDL